MGPKRASTRALRTRQTKLAFSPLPASSPAAANLSPSVRNRAANVSVEPSPSRPAKKRKTIKLEEDSDSDIGLLTPNKSFSLNPFSPAKKDVERGMRQGIPEHLRRGGMFGSEDDGGDSISSDSSSSGEDRGPVKKEKRKAQKKRKRRDTDSESSGEVPTRRGAKGRTRLATASAPKEEETDEDEDVSPPSTRRLRAKRSTSGKKKDVDDEEEGQEDEDEIRSPSPRRLRAKRPIIRKTQDLDDEEEEQDDSERVSTVPAEDDEDASDDSEQRELKEDLEFLQSSPPSSRDTLRSRKSKPLNARAKALEALKQRRAKASGSNVPPSSTPGRRRAIIEDNSDLEVIQENEDEEESPDDAHSNEEYEEEDDEEEEEEEEESDHKPTPRRNRTKARDMFEENDSDAGFIVDNSDEPIGEPADLTSMPLEFTSLARAKPRDLFKYAVEWMVHKKINPAFPSNDEIYTLTFRKLDDEVKGLANSKYSSAAWTSDFMRALRARPEMHVNELGRLERLNMDHHCEACNRRNHPATWTITFTGKPYNKDTLELLAEDSDSSSSDSESSISSGSSEEELNGEKPTYDAQGERIPPESKVFTVGVHCKGNAQMAHTLHHWRYHLNFWVLAYLEREGYCTPEELVKRDKLSTRKRAKQANKIVDRMEREGEIKKLHKQYKEQLDYALQAKNEVGRGWGRT